jgi:hypothetical protein
MSAQAYFPYFPVSLDDKISYVDSLLNNPKFTGMPESWEGECPTEFFAVHSIDGNFDQLTAALSVGLPSDWTPLDRYCLPDLPWPVAFVNDPTPRAVFWDREQIDDDHSWEWVLVQVMKNLNHLKTAAAKAPAATTKSPDAEQPVLLPATGPLQEDDFEFGSLVVKPNEALSKIENFEDLSTILFHHYGVTSAKKYARSGAWMPQKYEEEIRSLVSAGVTPSIAANYYKLECKAALFHLLRDIFTSLMSEDIVQIDDDKILTSSARYDFSHTLVTRSVNLQSDPFWDNYVADHFDTRLAASVHNMNHVEQAITYCLLYVLGSKYTEDTPELRGASVVSLPMTSIEICATNSGSWEMIVSENIMYLRKWAGLASQFKTSDPHNKVAYLATLLGKDDTTSLTVYRDSTCSTPLCTPLKFWYKMVGVAVYTDPKKNTPTQRTYSLLIALEMARRVRANTHLDTTFKSCFYLVDLGNNRFVRYTPELVRLLHIFADVEQGTTNLVILGSASEAAIVEEYLIQLAVVKSVKIKVYVNVSSTTSAKSLTGHKQTYVNMHVKHADGTPLYCRTAEFEGLVKVNCNVIYLLNPTDANTYISWAKPETKFPGWYGTVMSSHGTIYYLVSFARPVRYTTSGSGATVLKSDVPLPWKYIYDQNGAMIEKYTSYLADKTVPLGHNPHTSQRILKYAGGTGDCVTKIWGGNYKEGKNAEYQVAETVAMSQHRNRLIPIYRSAKIIGLNLEAGTTFIEPDADEAVDEV